MHTPLAKRPLTIAPIALLCAALVLLPLAAGAQDRTGGDDARGPAVGPLIGRKIPRATLGRLSGLPSASTVSVLVELDDEPTVATYAHAQASGGQPHAPGAARRQLARIRQAQARLASALAPLGAREIYRVQRVANGVAVRVQRGQLAAVAALPGVKAIWPLVRKRVDNASSVPLIGAPAVWGGSSALTGAGTTIAVIDTGIDYLHPDFGGSGLKADYDALDTTAAAPTFPTAKVAGGLDLVGDNYDASDPDLATPQPDPNPIDCVKVSNPGTVGHGSHVAGTAAGFGVLKSGATYGGAYTAALDFGQFRIGPGVAPAAQLYAYRVFGCDGSSEVIAAAIDAAVDPNGDGDPSDHVDVINMSLGTDYGAAVDHPGDPDITATNAAIAAGVVVVASAGNAGDAYYIASSPASADGTISVASSADAGSVADGFRVTAPAAIAGDYPSANATRWLWDGKSPVAGKLAYPPDQRSGCAPFSPGNTNVITGNIALLDWSSDCGSTERVNNAANAGAKGVILVYDQPMLDIEISGSPRIPATLTLPSVGQTLKATLASQDVSVTLTGELVNGTRISANGLSDTLSSFSSRGPRNIDGVLKPDIAAPGETIFSVRIGPGGRGQTLSGTSMAAPHVAGTMALLRQLHPNYSVAELKALAMNTATNDLRLGESTQAQIYGPARVGAGRVDVPNAAAGTVIAFNTAKPELVSVSFGNLQVVTTTTVLKQVTVANKGPSTSTFDIGYTPVSTVPGATYTTTPAAVTLAPGATATVNVALFVDAAATRHTHDPTVSETQVGEGDDWGRQWQSEASGYLTLTPPSAARSFRALVRGYYENPPVKSAVEATGLFTFTEASRNLAYSISFSKPITLTAGHIHTGKAGENGPIAQGFPNASGSVSALSGNLTLTAAEAARLLDGGLYANFHTTANPNGELRGQIVASEPALRVPLHAGVRAASATRATTAVLRTGGSGALGSTGAITLTGDDVLNAASPANPLLNAPTDDVSIVSAFELQATSPQLKNATAITASTDLRYVGVTSDFRRTATPADPTGSLDETSVYFGIATYGSWTTPVRDSFEVDIDVDRDGTNDYALFNTIPQDGPANDIHVAALCALDGEGACADDPTIVGYVNVLPGNAVNTNALDSSVLVLPLPLNELLELEEGASRFDYSVVGFDYYYGRNDATATLTYDPTTPGVDLSNANRAFGPAHLDLSGGTIPFTFSAGGYGLNRSQGVLLLHHHGASAATRAEVLRAPSRLLLPLVARP